MWVAGAEQHELLLEAAWLQGPLQDPDCLVTIQDADGHFLFVDPCAERVVGHPAEQLLGLRFENLLLPVDLDDARPLLALGRERLSHAILRLRCKDDERWFHTTTMPVGDVTIVLQCPTPEPAEGRCVPSRSRMLLTTA